MRVVDEAREGEEISGQNLIIMQNKANKGMMAAQNSASDEAN